MLTKAALLRTAPLVRAKMGKSGEQFDQVVDLVTNEGSANLARVLRSIYPGEKRERALANLRQLRLEIDKAANRAGVSLKLSGDGKTRTPAEKRLVWFDGDDRLMEATEEWVKPNLDGPNRYAQDAFKLGPIQLYGVYAEKDSSDAKKLLDALQPHFQTANMTAWTHANILPGENPEEERARKRQSCDLTLQFLSPQFQAAGLESEKTARVVPVLLHELAQEPLGVKVYRYRGKSFEKSNARDFALDLFLKIQDVLGQRGRDLDEMSDLIHHPVGEVLKGLRTLAQQEGKFVDNPASPVSLRREMDLGEVVTNRCDALTFLNQWLMDPKAPMYCALLGELGMGKTTTAREFARRLWERRKAGEHDRFPYFWTSGTSAMPPLEIPIWTKSSGAF